MSLGIRDLVIERPNSAATFSALPIIASQSKAAEWRVDLRLRINEARL